VTDIPDNVDLAWIAHHLVELRSEVRELRAAIGAAGQGGPSLSVQLRTLQDDLGVTAAILRRVDNNQTAYRDELRQLYELHAELRKRLDERLPQ
jgi:hypothetical protein